MDALRKYFPFQAKSKDITSLVIAIIAYVVIGVVGGFVIGLLGAIPVVGILCTIVGILLEIYTLAGIILAVLDFLGIKF